MQQVELTPPAREGEALPVLCLGCLGCMVAAVLQWSVPKAPPGPRGRREAARGSMSRRVYADLHPMSQRLPRLPPRAISLPGTDRGIEGGPSGRRTGDRMTRAIQPCIHRTRAEDANSGSAGQQRASFFRGRAKSAAQRLVVSLQRRGTRHLGRWRRLHFRCGKHPRSGFWRCALLLILTAALSKDDRASLDNNATHKADLRGLQRRTIDLKQTMMTMHTSW